MTCPRCTVAELAPLTGICELCGYSGEASVAVDRADPTAELARRQLAHEFTFGDVLGRGAHSTIVRVKENGSGRSVILKVMIRRPDEPDAEESFRGTLTAFSGFDHPHLMPVVRFGSTDSLFWFASPDVEGTSLRTLLQRKVPMDLRMCRRITTQLVSALDFLHRRGVVHGAIKADNVLLDKDGWVRLCDPLFVRARPRRLSRGLTAPGPRRTEPKTIAPRLPWVAPEEYARGERTPASDQFALAALVFECLAGHPPASETEDLTSLRPDIPPHVSHALARALAPDPLRRFVSCTDLLGSVEEGAGWRPESRSSGRVTEEIVAIKGWKPPPDPNRGLTIAKRLAVVLVIGGALAVATPSVVRVLRPPVPVPTARPITPAVVSPSVTTVPPSSPPPRASEPSAAEAPRRESPTPSRPATTRRPTRPAPAPAPVLANARVFINSTPWGQVFLDGELLGNTPRANVEVAPGNHVFRIVRTGYTPYERTLRVQPGDTLRLTDIVLEPIRP